MFFATGDPVRNTSLRFRVTAIELRFFSALGRDVSCALWLLPCTWVFAVDSWRPPFERFLCVLYRNPGLALLSFACGAQLVELTTKMW